MPNRNTIAQTPYLGTKCLACGLTGLEALSQASLLRPKDGCQGTPGRRHHFPTRTEATP